MRRGAAGSWSVPGRRTGRVGAIPGERASSSSRAKPPPAPLIRDGYDCPVCGCQVLRATAPGRPPLLLAEDDGGPYVVRDRRALRPDHFAAGERRYAEHRCGTGRA